jgi:soluble lytic murein transglycosylase-like protein
MATTDKAEIRPRCLLSAVLAAALLLVGVGPADLAGEQYQLQAAKERRVSQFHFWLAAQNGALGAADVLARSILQESEKHSLDPVLVMAVIQVESRFDRKAVSARGAQGLMQVRRVVVDELVGEGKIPARRHDLKDPEVNVQIGVSYLAHLVEMFGDLNTALAAYNSGPTRIREKLAANETIPSQYVSKVLRTQRSLEIELARLERADEVASAG